MSGKAPLKAVFFDRDGVLNLDHGYVCEPERLDWIEGAREAVAALNAAGVKVLVVTNQSGVARGYFTEAQVDLFHAALQAGLAPVGGRIDAFYVAPHHEDAVEDRYRHPDHPDRKPNPGHDPARPGRLVAGPERPCWSATRARTSRPPAGPASRVCGSRAATCWPSCAKAWASGFRRRR
jgi:histidinol-phosphate phosphatase family protein